MKSRPGRWARLVLACSNRLNARGLYLGRRGARIHVALYRWSGGRLGGHLPGWPAARVLLLDHTGARTGIRRTSPVMYCRDADRVAVAASKAGEPGHPAWFHNLLAHPETTVQIGRSTSAVTARVADPAERTRLWPRFAELYPGYDFYASRARGREIPVVILEPRA